MVEKTLMLSLYNVCDLFVEANDKRQSSLSLAHPGYTFQERWQEVKKRMVFFVDICRTVFPDNTYRGKKKGPFLDALLTVLCIRPYTQRNNTMGGVIGKVMSFFGTGKEYRVLVLGLDYAGKTTFVQRLKLGTLVETKPTVGFNLETVKYKNVSFQVWDMGGQTSLRPTWRCFYDDTDAIIWVLDSVDKERFGISRQELYSLFQEEELKYVNSKMHTFIRCDPRNGCRTAWSGVHPPGTAGHVPRYTVHERAFVFQVNFYFLETKIEGKDLIVQRSDLSIFFESRFFMCPY